MNNDDSTEKHDALIKASWQRCRDDFGLEHNSMPALERMTRGEVSMLQDQHQWLIQTTDTEVLPYYENILANAHCLILLADLNGNLLSGWGDKRFLEPRHKESFEAGSSWQEPLQGTNAIGTALASGQAVEVMRDEHFLRDNRFMIGSAAPIFDVNREMIGVLNISSDAYLPQAYTLGMVKLMTQSVENRLISTQFGAEHFLLSFNTNLDNIDSQWAGMIVFNEQGTIISANRRAELLLGYELALTNVADIIDYPLLELKNHPENLPLNFLALGKYRMHGVVRRPRQQSVRTPDFRPVQAIEQSVQGGNEQLPGPLDVIALQRIGFGDPRVDKAIRQAERIVEKDIPILIHGETGVGKEVFVKALHQRCSRREHSLVAVNCAAIPEDLVESELFGYEKGAFTGASSKGSIGLIRKAHKGVLFLDEIGEMPLKTQARLLRVLQERKVTPLGSTESYPVDIKLVSATNRSLRDQVEAGEFRQDLYYRVSGLNIELPALRSRQDKRELFREVHRIHRASDQQAELPDETLALFERHPWPGNIRQLVSVLQIALAMSDEDPLEPHFLPDDFFADLTAATRNESIAEEPAVVSSVPVQTVLEDTDDQQQLIELWRENHGNVSQTAKALGVSRNTLYKRLRELGLKE